MLLKVISTGSQAGNCYALIADNGEILLLDFGCEPNKILRGIGYKISDVCGACLTHSHGDHVKAYRWLFQNGIPIFTNDETAEHFEIISGEKMIGKPERIPFEVGSFRIVPFYVPHDGCPCYAYIISHPECGNIIYATDMSRIAQVDENYRLKMTDGKPVDWSFKNLRLSHMIIEANYDFSDFADMDEFKRSHVGFGHHSLQCCKRFVEENKTPDLRSVMLVHLSKDTDEENIRSQVQSVAGKWVNVAVAHAGDEYVLSKYPWEV